MGQELSNQKKDELAAYYKLQAEQMSILSEFTSRYAKDDLHHLLGQFKKMRQMLALLTCPWGEYIPMVHKGFLLYNNLEGSAVMGKKTVDCSVNIVKMMSEMIRLMGFVNTMIRFYDLQIEELEILIASEKSHNKK